MRKKKSPPRKEPNPGSRPSGDKGGDVGNTRRPDFDTNTVGHRPSDSEVNRRTDDADEEDTED